MNIIVRSSCSFDIIYLLLTLNKSSQATCICTPFVGKLSFTIDVLCTITAQLRSNLDHMLETLDFPKNSKLWLRLRLRIYVQCTYTFSHYFSEPGKTNLSKYTRAYRLQSVFSIIFKTMESKIKVLTLPFRNFGKHTFPFINTAFSY